MSDAHKVCVVIGWVALGVAFFIRYFTHMVQC